MSERKSVKTWVRTSIQNLVRHKSGRYYARTYGGGKETWKSLKTDLLEVAKVKLREFAGEADKITKAQIASDRGRMTMADCAAIFEQRLQDGYGLQGRGRQMRRITDSSRHYREQTLAALWRSWPELGAKDVRKLSEREVEEWARKFAAEYSATRYNNTLDTLRALFRVAIESGARMDNPADKVGRLPVTAKALVLPEREQFLTLVKVIRNAGGWCSRDCADLVQFLAFTGARKDEAANVLWSDVDFVRDRIHLRITKGGRPRHVPMIREARALMDRLHAEREGEAANTPVLRVREAQKAIDAAAKKVGMTRITHHDLRHLFATTCIEAGIDIPTVSRWLGHRDGGALAMRTYGHLRDDHSAQAAKRVSFDSTPLPANTLSFPDAEKRTVA